LGLGKLLDKRPPLYKAIRSFKAGDSPATIKSKYVQIKQNAAAIETAVKGYRKLIKGLGGTAETELGAALDTIMSDVVRVDKEYTSIIK
jgi:hypothetical protein